LLVAAETYAAVVLIFESALSNRLTVLLDAAGHPNHDRSRGTVPVLIETALDIISFLYASLLYRSNGDQRCQATRPMLKISSILCAGVAASLAACADEPLIGQKTFGPTTVGQWAQQDQATNVQDWHQMARKIADGLQVRGLLATAPEVPASSTTSTFAQKPFYIHSDQNTGFVRELSQALKAEILLREGLVATSANRAYVVDLSVNVVVWGSRQKSDPFRVRSEAVWHATINSGDRVLMTVQEPFYIFTSDIQQYVDVPEAPDPSLQLARIARPLSYSP